MKHLKDRDIQLKVELTFKNDITLIEGKDISEFIPTVL